MLDDCFCNDDVARALSDAGFTVEQFTDHFPREAGKREQGIKDPQVLALAHKHKLVILTTDRHMHRDHQKEFVKYQEAMIVATAHKEGGDEVWVQAFIKAKVKIERLHKKQPRPWHARINQNGDMTVCETVDCEEPAPPAKKAKKK